MTAPLVSICVANYQGAEVIETCLASILNQKCAFDFEVLVYDDASKDGSEKIVNDFFPQAILLAGRENVGYCTANRRMAEVAKGKYLLLFNNDAWLTPGSLQALADVAENLGKPAILGLPQYDASSGLLEDRGRLCDPFLNAVPNLDPARQEVAMVAGACLWLPRNLWFELGGFPEWFESTGEDLFLCCAARLRGYSVQVSTTGSFYHWIGHSIGGGKLAGGRLSSTSGRRFRSERNKMAVAMACFPAPLQYVWVLIIAIQLFLEGACLAAIKANTNVFFDIYLGALRDLAKRRIDLAAMELKPKPSLFQCLRFLRVLTWAPYKLSLLLRYGIPEIERRN